MSEQNQKTLRSFYCRDYLWDLFEVMSRDLGCSMDYLVNESMRYYARSRNYSLAASSDSAAPQVVSPQTANPAPVSQKPPPPLPGRTNAPAPREARSALYLLFNGQRYRVDKDQFVIGRGSQLTDLTIRDGNISRKHCVVVFRGGNYFIKDLKSTNGIEFNEERIEYKRIEEGDTFFLCDYELRFTYR